MFVFADTGSGLVLINLDYHQSVAERHRNLVLKFAYLKFVDGVIKFNIIGLVEEKKLKRYNYG